MRIHQAQTIPGSSRTTNTDDLRQMYFHGEKITGQVIKDVNILYFLDPGVKHKPEILKGTCKVHTSVYHCHRCSAANYG